jgi:hypothetical protein
MLTYPSDFTLFRTNGFRPTVLARIFFVAILSLVFMLLSQAVHAEERIDPKKRERGLKDAPQLIIDSNVSCELNDAIYTGQGRIKKDGKDLKADTFEVSCKSGQGYIFFKLETGVTDTAYNCLQAESFAKSAKGITVCTLPSNKPNYTWLTAVIKPVATDCVVTKARFLGAITSTKSLRYEAVCTSGISAIYDVPDLASQDQKVKAISCLQVAESTSKCEYTTTEQAVKALAPLAQQASKSCIFNNARFLGSGKDVDYFEIGCANQAGFVILVGAGNTYKNMAGCDQAEGLNGGCKFTDAKAIAAEKVANYATLLKAAGITCTISDYAVTGSQPSTNRDFVEFKCPEQAFGLIGFVPNPNSTASLDVFDCYQARARKRECQFVTEGDLLANLKSIIGTSTDIKQDCILKEVRYIGLAASNDVLVELACENKRGYIAAVNAKRTAYSVAQPCTIAATRKDSEKCEIPGNGTYVLK